jgi:hypothetical protein
MSINDGYDQQQGDELCVTSGDRAFAGDTKASNPGSSEQDFDCRNAAMDDSIMSNNIQGAQA